MFNSSLNWGGGVIEPWDAKISEKCLCSYNYNTALIKNIRYRFTHEKYPNFQFTKNNY